MMYIKLTKFSLFCILFSLLSCGSYFSGVHHDYDAQYAFQTAKTFAFSKTAIDRIELINDLDKKRILYALDQSLLSKGLMHSDSNPSLKLGFRITEIQQNYPAQVGMGFGGPFWFFNTQRPVNQFRYILHIEARDYKTSSLVWEGQGNLPVYRAMDNPQKRSKVFSKVVQRIMRDYPYQGL